MEPEYAIQFQPRCDGSGISQLFICITLESPQRKAQETLCRLDSCEGYPAYTYNESNVHAEDDNGSLGIVFSSNDTKLTNDWKLERDTTGNVVLYLEVHPRTANNATPPRPTSELLRDQGGVFGIGAWFLPNPVYIKRFKFSVAWDLSLAHANTRASWSYGDGAGRTTVSGPIELLFNSAFMVGPIRSLPQTANAPVETAIKNPENPCVVHWLGQLPKFLQNIYDLDKRLFLYIRVFFQDAERTHTVYIRKVGRGFAGFNFNECYMIEYCDLCVSKTETELIRIMTHEMVHNWAVLGNEPDGYQNLWFIEGVAEFYAAYLPVRAGVKGIEYFRQILDWFLSEYYTNPAINTPMRKLGNGYNHTSLLYKRGFLYFLLTDAALRLASNRPTDKINPIDDVIMEAAQSYDTDIFFWLSALYPLLGQDNVDAGFQDLMNGATLMPDPDFTFPIAGKVIKLEAIEQEMFEMGFSCASLKRCIIEGLVSGSRAELAGLRNGDAIVARSLLTQESFEGKFWFLVERNGQRVEVEYWPRSLPRCRAFAQYLWRSIILLRAKTLITYT